MSFFFNFEICLAFVDFFQMCALLYFFSHLKEFVREKVVFPSYSSAILGPPPSFSLVTEITSIHSQAWPWAYWIRNSGSGPATCVSTRIPTDPDGQLRWRTTTLGCYPDLHGQREGFGLLESPLPIQEVARMEVLWLFKDLSPEETWLLGMQGGLRGWGWPD